ncbi:Quinic acid utilization activator [Fusarium oxysporum f. sp. albedinis]|nr:Quinic acid utilization activator [Fusarium oxysporum f. sp. albedinis]
MAASSEMPLPKSVLVFNWIVEQVTRCAEKLADIRLPAHKHQDDMQAIRAKASAAWERIPKAKELQQIYEMGLRDAQAKYERRVDLIVTALCEALDESADTLSGTRG